MQTLVISAMLCCACAVVGCGNRPMEATLGARLTQNTAPKMKVMEETSPAPLQALKWTLPQGWKASYDGASHWKIENAVPPDQPFVLVWVLARELVPSDLIDFSHTLQTSSKLTDGKFILDRATEQGSFADGYYVVGKFFRRGDRRTQNFGLAMIRKLRGHTLIFECMKINDPDQRQEVLDICKSARF
jgi:hypothetical protein